MQENTDKAAEPVLEPRERLIVALDVATAAEARSLVDELRGHVGAFKIGLQLFTAAGPDIVRDIAGAGHRVFLDLKFHDIPNTVAAACVEAARLGVWMMNVHAAGGSEMMNMAREAVAEACRRESLTPPKLIAVTVLTSFEQSTLTETGVELTVDDQIATLAILASNAGLDGVVASPWEVEMLRRAVDREHFLIVTPGIRLNSATNDDQKRVRTFAQAVAAGADYIVVGRPITQAADKVAAVEAMLAGS